MAPRICRTTPLKRKQKGDGPWNEEEHANGIQALNMGLEIGRRVVLLGWRPKEDHEDERDKPDGKVDVETPTPRGSVGEATTDQRAHDGGETEHQAEQALECGSLVQGDHGNHDQHATREDAGGCQTSNGPSDDEHDGALSSAANSRAGLKDHHADKKDPIVSQLVKGENGRDRRGPQGSRCDIGGTIWTHHFMS